MHLIPGAICLLALLALASCGPQVKRTISSRVLAIDGEARCSVGGQTALLAGDSFLPPGAKINSGKNARVDLMVLPGVLIELAGDTEIEIVRLRLERDGNESIHPMIAREAEIRLLRGSITASVGQAETDSQFLVHTSFGTIDTGPAMSCRVRLQLESARVLCVRGEVVVSPAGTKARTAIPSGQFADLSAAGAAPRLIAAAEAATQAEVPAVLATDQRLRRLFEEKGAGFIPW